MIFATKVGTEGTRRGRLDAGLGSSGNQAPTLTGARACRVEPPPLPSGRGGPGNTACRICGMCGWVMRLAAFPASRSCALAAMRWAAMTSILIAASTSSRMSGIPVNRLYSNPVNRKHGDAQQRRCVMTAIRSTAFPQRRVFTLLWCRRCGSCQIREIRQVGITARRIAEFTALRLCGAGRRARDRRARP